MRNHYWRRFCWLFLLALMFSACLKAPSGPPTEVSKLDSSDWQNIKQVVRQKFPTVRQLSTSELAAQLQATDKPRPILLDARTPEEYAISHLPQAHNAASAEQIAAALKNAPKDAPIVAYCAVGYRSSALAEKLRAQGYTNIANLEGSIFQWANEGRPVFQGEKEVHQVHPFDKKWGLLLKQELWSPLPE
ncbi:MAG: rhodanese-like domain-containing protein [Blastocatellia bacterium]